MTPGVAGRVSSYLLPTVLATLSLCGIWLFSLGVWFGIALGVLGAAHVTLEVRRGPAVDGQLLLRNYAILAFSLAGIVGFLWIRTGGPAGVGVFVEHLLVRPLLTPSFWIGFFAPHFLGVTLVVLLLHAAARRPPNLRSVLRGLFVTSCVLVAPVFSIRLPFAYASIRDPTLAAPFELASGLGVVQFELVLCLVSSVGAIFFAIRRAGRPAIPAQPPMQSRDG